MVAAFATFFRATRVASASANDLARLGAEFAAEPAVLLAALLDHAAELDPSSRDAIGR